MPTEAQQLDAEKLKTLNRCLLDEYVLVHINPKAPDVIVPEQLALQPTVTLKLSRLFRGAMQVKTDRVEAELLFGSSYFKCVLPFNAIWGVTNYKNENFIWGQSAPGPQAAVQNEASEAPKPKAPFLRRVK